MATGAAASAAGASLDVVLEAGAFFDACFDAASRRGEKIKENLGNKNNNKTKSKSIAGENRVNLTYRLALGFCGLNIKCHHGRGHSRPFTVIREWRQLIP